VTKHATRAGKNEVLSTLHVYVNEVDAEDAVLLTKYV